MLTLDPAVETWAVACDRHPRLVAFVHIALDLRTQLRCKAGDWQALLDLLVIARAPVEVYDAAVEVLHRTALMPCRCSTCIAFSDEIDRAIKKRPSKKTAAASSARRYRLGYRAATATAAPLKGD